MSVTDERILPLCRVRLYAPGQGDPVVVDHGHGSRYDVLAETARFGSSDLTSGEQNLEYLEGIGLVCRPVLVLQDTRTAHYTTSGGSWEEARPSTGSPRKYRLVQYDKSVNVQFSRTSSFALPANPDVAFSMVLPDTPTDHDSTTYPPYLRFELGNGGQWALEFAKSFGGRLLKKISGSWEAVAELPEPAVYGNSDHEEVLVLLRCLRGRFAISTDRGRSYTYYGEAGRALSISSGSYTIRGQGGACSVGLHQLLYRAGVYTAPQWSTFTSRSGPAVSITAPTPCRLLPSGTTIVFADHSSHGAQVAGWRATLTPASTNMGTPGWAVYRTPELYAVRYEFPVTYTLPSYVYTEPYTGSIEEATIEKPLELDAASGTLRIRKSPAEQFVYLLGRWAKAEIYLGHLDDSGVMHYTPALVGYVRSPYCATEQFNAAPITLAIDNISVRFKRTKWARLNRLPLGGQSVNAALLAGLESEGQAHLYPAHLRHPWGDALVLPYGSAEDPFEWPPEGEAKWETMRRLAGYAGLELVPLDSGYFETLPYAYVAPVVSKNWEFQPATDLKNLVLRAGYGYDSGETVTAIEVYGVSEYGEELVAYYVNTAAETNPSSGEFCPWRETHVEHVPGTTTMPLLVARCQALARELCTLKQEADVLTLVDLTTARRDRGRVTGSLVGINDSDEFGVLALRHVCRPMLGECQTTAGLRRVR